MNRYRNIELSTRGFGVEAMDGIQCNPDTKRNEGAKPAMHSSAEGNPFLRSLGVGRDGQREGEAN